MQEELYGQGRDQHMDWPLDIWADSRQGALVDGHGGRRERATWESRRTARRDSGSGRSASCLLRRVRAQYTTNGTPLHLIIAVPEPLAEVRTMPLRLADSSWFSGLQLTISIAPGQVSNPEPLIEPEPVLADDKHGHVLDADIPVVGPLTNDEPIVTRRELWSYYLYYNGDNGVGPNGYAMTLFQSLATSAGYDPTRGPGSSCLDDAASGQCVLPWGKGTKSVSSIVLVANGICFAIMTMIFTTIGSAADYGTFGRWLLLVVTVICWGAQFASMSLTCKRPLAYEYWTSSSPTPTLTAPDRWGAAMGLYMVGFVTYGATLVFYAALFPRLARNTQHARDLREKYENGEIPAALYEQEESMEKNRISNISTMHSNIGYIFTLALNLSLLLPLKTNPKVNNYVIVLTNGYWVLTGIWWFIYQQPRPGPSLPKGESYITIGWKQIWIALKQYKKLPYTFIYLLAFFLLADVDGRDSTRRARSCPSARTTSSASRSCRIHTSVWHKPSRPPSGKTMLTLLLNASTDMWTWIYSTSDSEGSSVQFVVTNVVTVMIPLWGMIGIWTTKFGFHNVWEFWAYNVVFGLFQAPYYAFSQTMMAELTPPGFDNM
ncbi:hypothetical protein EVG20_g3925, partial [Dentipellis fragilis]